MTPHRLTATEARRIAVRAQLLDEQARPGDLVEMTRRLTLLQVDRTRAVAPSAELVAWSRLGEQHPRDGVDEAIERRELIDLRGLARPPEDIALHRADMLAWDAGAPLLEYQEAQRDWVDDNEACRRDILAVLRTDGPLPRTELPAVQPTILPA